MEKKLLKNVTRADYNLEDYNLVLSLLSLQKKVITQIRNNNQFSFDTKVVSFMLLTIRLKNVLCINKQTA